jgi:hypothetical protein
MPRDNVRERYGGGWGDIEGEKEGRERDKERGD